MRERSRRELAQALVLLLAGGCSMGAPPDAAIPDPGFRPCGANGGFSGEVVARFLDDGRRMRLESPFGYVDPDGVLWPAPEGVIVDGASIPRFLWAVVGSPFVGEYREASVVHDVACDERTRPWRDVHRMFYQACRCGGVGRIRAKVLFAAVHHFGPRWDTSGMLLPSTLTEEEAQERFERMAAYIEANDPDLEGIEGLDP